jgi:hypothetical protein
MTLYQPDAMELIAPALYRRTHLTSYFVARERERVPSTGTHPRRPYRPSRALQQSLRIGRNLLYTLWGTASLASWLVLAVGYLR